jgi:hypothetical protein
MMLGLASVFWVLAVLLVAYSIYALADGFKVRRLVLKRISEHKDPIVSQQKSQRDVLPLQSLIEGPAPGLETRPVQVALARGLRRRVIQEADVPKIRELLVECRFVDEVLRHAFEQSQSSNELVAMGGVQALSVYGGRDALPHLRALSTRWRDNHRVRSQVAELEKLIAASNER